MLIFLRKNSDPKDVITSPRKNVTLVDTSEVDTSEKEVISTYKREFPPINQVKDCVIVPWYEIDADPEAFGKKVLAVANEDPVCKALIQRATTTWRIDFSITDTDTDTDTDTEKKFKTQAVQDHYLKQLKIWLSPLSGNIGNRTAHCADFNGQYNNVWEKYGLDKEELKNMAEHKFFGKDNSFWAGRRDRAQFYRNITEVARALVGEVTSWPSRYIEKAAVLSLLRSPGLAEMQRKMLAAAAEWILQSKCTWENWEYLPYYLYGKASDNTVQLNAAEPLVLGAICDCINDEPTILAEFEKKKEFDRLIQSHHTTFQKACDKYNRWRLLPPVVRYQVLISDLARIMPGGKINSQHKRVEFTEEKLNKLANIDSLETWQTEMKNHSSTTPHAPDDSKAFPFAAGWARNEYCPNVVTSRLLLAPLYGGTSGHTQGRILAWMKLAEKVKTQTFNLNEIPIGLVVSAGYSVLWRLYYDKRVSNFHTLFETLQGSHVDVDNDRELSSLSCASTSPDDEIWKALLGCSPNGKVDIKKFWLYCIRRFNKHAHGLGLDSEFKALLAKERRRALKANPDTRILRWNITTGANLTAPNVGFWNMNGDINPVRKSYKEEKKAKIAAVTKKHNDTNKVEALEKAFDDFLQKHPKSTLHQAIDAVLADPIQFKKAKPVEIKKEINALLSGYRKTEKTKVWELYKKKAETEKEYTGEKETRKQFKAKKQDELKGRWEQYGKPSIDVKGYDDKDEEFQALKQAINDIWGKTTEETQKL